MNTTIRKFISASTLIKEGRFDLFRYKLLKKLGFKNILPPLPIWLVVEPVNFCNLRCPICPFGSGKMTRSPRVMTFLEFKKIIDEVRGYTTKMLLYNYGEPFLNPEIFEMIRYAADADIRVRLSTNGMLIKSKEMAEEIIRSGAWHLTFSFDGLDQETLTKYRKGANVDDVIRAIELVVGAKRELGSKTPKIELQFLVTKNNEHQRKAMGEFAQKIGVDSYLEKFLHLYGETDFQDIAKEYLPSDLSFSRYNIKEGGVSVSMGEIKNKCTLVEESAAINSDGSVVPCYYDFNSQYTMGNVFGENLKDIWKNKKYQAFRQQINKDRKKIPLCTTCPEGREAFMGKRQSVTKAA